MPVPDELFRSLLRRHAAGVVVVTAAGDPPAGFTATSFTSVSLRPPLVSFCLNRTSSCWSAIACADHVAVHVLTANQERVARTFATRDIDRFAPPVRWHTGPFELPVLDGVAAMLVCRIIQRVPAGGGVVVLAEVVAGDAAPGPVEAPLVYHMGEYLRPS